MGDINQPLLKVQDIHYFGFINVCDLSSWTSVMTQMIS